MNSIVIYASRYGNTEKVARAIADGLRKSGPTALYALDQAPHFVPQDTDLVVVGGPTEAHRLTRQLADYLEALGRDGLVDKAGAAFDTRLRAPRLLTGSAAHDIDRKMRAAGAELIAEPESFFVAGKDPVLVAGELERAGAWAERLAKPLATAAA
jgi:menaquinone-dependent protoporphyrinogen IX oxidase